MGYVLDTFDRADSASSLGTSANGQDWAVSAGTTWGISGNKAYCPTLGSVSIWPGPGGHAVVETNNTFQVVQVVITGLGGASACTGVIGRYSDASNFWVAFIMNVSGVPTLYCGPVVAGSVTYSVANGITLSGSGPWVLELLLNGDNASVFIDGVQRGSTVSNSFNNSATKAGLLAGNANAQGLAVFDNFAAETPGSTGTGYAGAVLRDAPVGYWRLNEASGTQAKDLSVNANHGTYTGTPTLGTASPLKGDPGAAAMTLNGTSQYVLLPAASVLEVVTPLSLECFLKTSYAGASWQTIFGSHDGATFGFALDLSGASSPVGKPAFWNHAAWTEGMANVNDGNWHHLVVTHKGTTLQCYLDAIAAAPVSGVAAVGAMSWRDNHALGAIENHTSSSNATWNAAANFFNGSLAECAAYPFALSAARVATHYREALRGGVVVG